MRREAEIGRRLWAIPHDDRPSISQIDSGFIQPAPGETRDSSRTWIPCGGYPSILTRPRPLPKKTFLAISQQPVWR